MRALEIKKSHKAKSLCGLYRCKTSELPEYYNIIKNFKSKKLNGEN
jgi:hypothetical protein